MPRRFLPTLQEVLTNKVVLFSLLSFAMGFVMAWGAATSSGERQAIKWAVENSDDCAEYFRDEYGSIGECLHDRYSLIQDERRDEAAAEQYP